MDGIVSNMENGGGIIEGGSLWDRKVAAARKRFEANINGCADSKRHTGNIVYRGARNGSGQGGQVVTRNAQILRPFDSQRLLNHSPDGFNWGYGGSGPAQLALALLLDATGDPGTALTQHQNFKRAIVADFTDEWELAQGEIIAWLNSLPKDPGDEMAQAIKSYRGQPT